MSILQKAIKRNKEAPNTNQTRIGRPDSIEKKLVSGCYGIDNLFSDKSKKLSFVEFWAGLKDIFLGIVMFIPKILSSMLEVVKRPGYALCIFCASIMTTIIVVSHETEKPAPNIAITRHVKFTSIGNNENNVNAPVQSSGSQNATTTSSTREISAGTLIPNTRTTEISAVQNTVSSSASVVMQQTQSIEERMREKKFRFSRAFESKVNGFFLEHRISDIMCKDGCCRLRIGNDVFCEHSALCEYPKIVLESSTEDELIFSDGAENYCAMKIDNLFQ